MGYALCVYMLSHIGVTVKKNHSRMIILKLRMVLEEIQLSLGQEMVH